MAMISTPVAVENRQDAQSSPAGQRTDSVEAIDHGETASAAGAATRHFHAAAASARTDARIIWIDVLKGLAILLVVLSHTAIVEVQREVLYLFHMPLFFWLSGLLYRPEKYPSLGLLIRRRSQSLIVPYLWFSLISYVLWFFIARHFGNDAGEHTNPWLPVLGTIYSVANEPWLTHNTVLWFLTCLFVVETLYWGLRRWLPSTNLMIAGLLVCSATGFWLSLHSSLRWPWGADVALSAVLFYGAGNLSQPLLAAYESSSRRKQSALNVAATILGIAAMWWGFGFVNMSENILGPGYPQFYAAAFGGIAVSIVVARAVPPNRVINLIGRNTLVILCLQLPCFGLVKAVQQYGCGIEVAAARDSLTWGIIHTGAIVGLLIPVIYAIDRWAPFLIGKRRVN